MNVTGTPSADGLVFVNCPSCDAALRVKPRAARTTVPCVACGQKFVLEVAGLPPTSGATPPPVPAPSLDFRSDKPPASRAKRAPRRDDEDDRPRRQPAGKKMSGAVVGLIVGGGVAALLLVGGLVTGLVFLLRDREPKAPAVPVAAAPDQRSAVEPSPVVRPVAATTEKIPAVAATTVESKPTAPKPGPAPKVPPKADPMPTRPDPDPTEVTPAKAPPPKEGPAKGGPAGIDKEAVERVKKSTALIECKEKWGTGFVIRPGLVMTNAHVTNSVALDDLRVSFVTLDDTAPPKLKPTLLYTDPRRDLAILRVDTDRPPLEMVERGTDLSGMEVAVVGNPRGDGGQAQINKVTTGKLSAPVRRDAGWTYYELFAEAFFGNSGGPVVERKTGKLVGVMQSILGDGKSKSYCIPFGEAQRALDTLPPKEDEAKAARVAAGRHYLGYIHDHLPEMERFAELAMQGQLNRLRAKARGGDVRVTVRLTDGRALVLTLTEFMDLMREKHNQNYPVITKVVPTVGNSPEIPSALKSAMRLRVETYSNMYGLADGETKTEKGFLDAIDARKSANAKAAKAFQEAYDKFFDDLERNPPKK